MSRSQQEKVLNTATDNSKTNQTAAVDANAAEEQGIKGYEAQLAKFSASNPFTEGGEFDKATDQKLAGVADAGSMGLKDALQTQALRTGQNRAGANATAAEATRANLRDLVSEEADATKQRIAAEAGYGEKVLEASAAPATLEQARYATSLGGANQALGIAGDASKTPSFWENMGNSFAQALGNTAGGGNVHLTKAI
jgi:hypothetical protein